MYIKTINHQCVRLAFALAVVLFNSGAWASTVVNFDFEDPDGQFETTPETISFGLEAQPWSDQAGSLTSFSGNPGRALAARTFLDGNALLLELQIQNGFKVDLNGFAFDHLASASGPANWELKVNDVAIASGTTVTSFVHVSEIFSLTGITDTITVALFGYNAASNSGTYRLDNFSLTGTVSSVPLAPGLIFMSSGLAFLFARLKR